MNEHVIVNTNQIKQFLLVGKAIFTFKVRQVNLKDSLSPFFVSTMTGYDNEHNYRFIGTINQMMV